MVGFLNWYKASKRLRRRLLEGRVEASETKQGGRRRGGNFEKPRRSTRKEKKKTPEPFRTVYPLHRPGSYRLREAQRVRVTEDEECSSTPRRANVTENMLKCRPTACAREGNKTLTKNPLTDSHELMGNESVYFGSQRSNGMKHGE